MIELQTPVDDADIAALHVGDVIRISGFIYCGRDAVLPKICRMLAEGEAASAGLDFSGGAMFHTAVSPAGIGPTSSNKVEIEGSFVPLSEAGLKIHLGKGAISAQTVAELGRLNAVYAVIPPVTALLGSKTSDVEIVAFPELGMEALHRVKIHGYEAIIAAAHGESIYDK